MLQDASPLRRAFSRALPHFARASVGMVALLLSGAICGRAAVADKPGLMPAPASIQQGQGYFQLTPNLRVTYARFHDARLEAGTDRVLRRAEYISGLPQMQASKGDGAIVVDVAGDRADEKYQ